MPRRAILLTVLLAFCIPRAIAQGTGGLLPDPISTADLIEWFDALYATKDQRAQVLALHDEYLAKCRELREGRIQALLDKDRDIWATSLPGALIVRAELADFLRQRGSIGSSFAQLENQLLSSIAESLTNDQRGALESIRIERECDRLAANKLFSPWFARVSHIDFDTVFTNAKLTEDEIDFLRSEIDAHHRAIAPALHRLGETIERHLLAYVDRLVEQGYVRNPAVPANEEFIERDVNLAAWWDNAEDTRKRAKDVIRIQVETAARIAAALPVQSATRFRLAFAGMMREVAGDSHLTRGSTIFDEALQRDDLTNEQRAAILQQYEQWAARWGAIIDQGARAAVEDSAGQSWTMGDPMRAPELEQQRRERFVRQQAQFEAVNAEALAALGDIIGADDAEAVVTAIKARWEAELATRRADPDAVLSFVKLRSDAMAFLPPQINSEDIKRFLQLNRFDQATTEAVRDVHDRYMAALRDLAATGFAAMIAEPVGIRIDEVARLGVPPSHEQLERGEAARAEVIGKLVLLEDHLFDELEAIDHHDAGNSALALFRLHRQNRRLGEYRGNWTEITYLGYRERGANLVEVVEDAEMSESSRALAREMLLHEADRIADALQVQFQAHVSQVHHSWRQQCLFFDLQQAEVPVEERNRLWQESDIRTELERADERSLSARLDLIELNRRIVHEIAEALGEISRTDAEMLRRAYRRNAYPAVYDDPDSAAPMLERALKFEGLAELQLRDIIALLANFQDEYEAHSEGICTVFSERPFRALSGAGSQSLPDLTTRREQIENLRFYRREVSDRARVDLMDILTPEQWAMLMSMSAAQSVN